MYDFRNPPNRTGFAWDQVGGRGSQSIPPALYLAMISHPIADAGFQSDYEAMQWADTFVLLLPCGRSAHLELGWAIGAGKRTVVFLDNPVTPELMYKLADEIVTSGSQLLKVLEL